MARGSGEWAPSYETTHRSTCVSALHPFSKLGLSGLSTSLDTSVSLSLGLPSRLKKEPVVRPAAEKRSE